MKWVKRALYIIFGEPFIWFFYWSFQPRGFRREFERGSLLERIVPLLRLLIPIFLIAYPCVLAVRISIRVLLAVNSPNMVSFLLLVTLATLIGLAIGLVGGLPFGLAGSIGLGLAGAIGLGLAVGSKDKTQEAYLLAGITGGLVTGCLSGIAGERGGKDVVLGMIAGVGAGFVAGPITWLLIRGNSVSMLVGCTVGTTVGLAASRRKSSSIGLLHRERGLLVASVIAIGVGIINIYYSGIAFAIGFLLVFYRLPLYPVSGFSSLKTYFASRKQPTQVFRYLHRSSLYWDECVYLPLPRLKKLLLLAAEQSTEHTLAEITFIAAERPQQISAARSVALEIAVQDIEMCKSLRDIAQASLRLSEIFPYGTALVNPQWSTALVLLNNVSQNATRACSPLGWQGKHDAVEEMLTDLERLHPYAAIRDVDLGRRFASALTVWSTIAERELDILEQAPEKTRYISNPYNPGPTLERFNKLFVGRYDLAQQLGEALARGDGHPTFLLHGERRMGKTSILKHLPDLLGARYLPIFYDLQSPDITSSAAAFLGSVAEGISHVMSSRGMKGKKLAFEQLKQASRENEATVYYVFNKWLKGIERILEREDRKLLLMFDEFEMLDQVGRNQYLNLELLFNWLRSIMQHHCRLVLLFSAVQTFATRGTNWSGYFVNVQTLKVSFLHHSEAWQLVTQPLQSAGNSNEQPFDPGVIEEIIQVTNAHPFLVQALCSALIDSLNAKKRNRIAVQDIGEARSKIVKNWGSTYFRDLWTRTDADQRICLTILQEHGSSDLSTIEQYGGLSRQTARWALETLLDRDLVLLNGQGLYQIAVPIFGEWVEQNVMR